MADDRARVFVSWENLLRFGALIVVVGSLALIDMFAGPRALPEHPIYGSTPILRLSGAQHTSNVTRGALSADGQTMVTASRDNTVKVWRVATMSVVNTIRVPIANEFLEDPGAAFMWAVDITPDATMVAAAGQVRSDGTFRVFVFNTYTGEILATPLEAMGFIADVTFSRDGRLLAAGLFNEERDPNNGLYVWDTSNWELVYRDADYGRGSDRGGRINGMRFNAEGVLITASYDRHLRRYADVRAQTPPLVVATPPVLAPYDLEFNTEGTQIVVGLQNRQEGDDPAAVVIYDAETLAPVREMSVAGLRDGQGGRVAASTVRGVSFSKNGRYLYANLVQHAVGVDDEIVRRWEISAPGAPYRDYQNCTDQTVIQILPHGESGAILLNSDPCVSAVDEAGEITRYARMMRYAIYEDDLPEQDSSDFLVSARGDRFYMRGVSGGEDAIMFDLRARTLTRGAVLTDAQRAQLGGYTQDAGAIHLRNWANQTGPTFNGRELPIRDTGVLARNHSFSVDIAADGAFAAIGTIFRMQRYSRPEAPDWSVTAPTTPMRTNISADGNVIVAYYLDGVFRWHDVRDGRVLLSLILDVPGDRWLLWTPGGYYDGSPNADDMIGWHVNRGPDEAPIWQEAGRYADVFRSRDIVSGVVEAMIAGQSAQNVDVLETARSLRVARDTVGPRAPPLVHIVGAQIEQGANGPQMAVTFSAESPSGKPILGVELDVDGSALPVENIRLEPSEQISRTIPIHAGDRFVRVRARTADGWGQMAHADIGMALFQALTPLERSPPGRPRSAPVELTERPRPVLHALVVGVNYRGVRGINELRYGVTDAEAFADLLELQADTALFREVRVTRLLERQATLRNLHAELSRLSRVGRDDVVLIFLAGHGIQDDRDHYFFLPYGVTPNMDTIENDALTGVRIAQTLADTRARALLFMDTCSSQGAMERSFLADIQNLQKNVYTFTSSRDGQNSLESITWGHGAFTRALLDVARGGDRRIAQDGLVRYSELGPYLYDRVVALTERRQAPQYFGWGPHGANPDSDIFQVVRRR